MHSGALCHEVFMRTLYYHIAVILAKAFTYNIVIIGYGCSSLQSGEDQVHLADTDPL